MCLAQMHWFHTLHCYRRPQNLIPGLFPYLFLLQLYGKSIIASQRFLDASKIESHDYNVLRYFSSSGVKLWHCTNDCKFVGNCVPSPNTFPKSKPRYRCIPHVMNPELYESTIDLDSFLTICPPSHTYFIPVFSPPSFATVLQLQKNLYKAPLLDRHEMLGKKERSKQYSPLAHQCN
jgi:hypothetical protein